MGHIWLYTERRGRCIPRWGDRGYDLSEDGCYSDNWYGAEA